MTEEKLIALAQRLGWNTEHAETNKRLVTFARTAVLFWKPTPMTPDQIHNCFNHVEYETAHNWLIDPEGWCIAFARAVEKCHGIGDGP